MAALRSALAALPGHLRTKFLLLSISFGFCLEKKGPLPLYIFYCFDSMGSPHLPPLWYNIFFLWTATVISTVPLPPPPKKEKKVEVECLLLLVIYWGSYKLRLNAGILNNYSESAQGIFFLHWLKAHLQHTFDIRVTQWYTVHHSSCNRSLRGRLH